MNLPGQDAQYKAVPPNRPFTDLEKAHRNPATRKAAVMALVHPVNDISHLALIRRNEYPGVHSGQVSFPGGKVEAADKNLVETATRETREEVGVNPEEYQVYSELTEVFIPPSQFLVQPYVGMSRSELHFEKDDREVVKVIHAPLSVFAAEGALQNHKMDLGGLKMNIPAYEYEGNIIWGATAMMISELMEVFRRI